MHAAPAARSSFHRWSTSPAKARAPALRLPALPVPLPAFGAPLATASSWKGSILRPHMRLAPLASCASAGRPATAGGAQSADSQPRSIESSVWAWKRCCTQLSTARDFVNRSALHILPGRGAMQAPSKAFVASQVLCGVGRWEAGKDKEPIQAVCSCPGKQKSLRWQLHRCEPITVDAALAVTLRALCLRLRSSLVLRAQAFGTRRAKQCQQACKARKARHKPWPECRYKPRAWASKAWTY